MDVCLNFHEFRMSLAPLVSRSELSHRSFSGVDMRKILLAAACFVALAPMAQGATTPFLDFPLSCPNATQGKCSSTRYSKGAYTPASMTSVLDHHMEKPYDEDGIVTAFTGEEGRATAAKPKVNQGCYPQYSPNPGKSFIIKGLYIGTNDGCLADQGLNYDNHPAYDYVAEIGTPVYAAASGRVVKIVNKATGLPGRCVPKGIETGGCGIWGYVGIDHGNGYVTQYGHLSRIDVQSGDEINAGALIGLTGQSSPPTKDKNGNVTKLYSVPPHFHFEVLKENSGSPYGYAFVDPYGWEGDPRNDPLEKATGIPNVRLWKTGAQASPADPKVSAAPNSTTALPKRTEPPGRLVYATCFQMECFKRYLVTESRNTDGLMVAKVATTYHFNDAGYSKNEHKDEFARLNAMPVKYSTYKASCKIPGGYIELDDGTRIPQPERNVSHATEAEFKVWKAVCDGLESGAISGETDAILRTVANSDACPPSYGRPKIGKVIGKYATAICICKKEPDCDNATAYLKKVDNRWVLVDHGTGIFPENLISYGFPKNIAYALTRH